MNKIKLSFFMLLVLAIQYIALQVTYAEDKKLNISPIVQVISYYDLFGKHPVMMGWGSASIINDKGVIISNNHVVDDGKGALSSAFSICITKDLNKKPICDYTASLIARDDKLDISMLKIDPIDIYGNKVDFNNFKSIDIDYNYEPKNQDETVAIGYPWIGADTISETKGIVSGTSNYNGYKYIKTDTLIAGGNSGGAFIKDGKLIGIPTFGIGWGDSMGYALSIKEAKTFIEENIKKESTKNKVTDIIDFNGYRKKIEGINSKLELNDDIFSIKFNSDYEVTNYKNNKYIELGLKKQKDTGVNFLSMYIEKSPKLETQRKLFYYLESIGFYYKDYQKLLKTNIGGIDFYYPVDKTDLSNGDSSWGKSYKALVDGYIISIELQAPLYDEKRNKEVKKEIDYLLSGIKINKQNLKLSSNIFSTNIPKIEFKNNNNSIADTGKYKIFLGNNLYEYININLNELIEYYGKGKSVEEIYNVQLKDVDDSEKAKIIFKGYEGYITCSNKVSFYNYYNYYGYYGFYGNTNTDEYGNPIDVKTCQINIYFPLDKVLNRQNYISIELKSESAKLSENLTKTIEFLKNNLILESNDQTVDIPNILSNQIQLKYKDLGKQTEAYKNFLKLLIRFNAINNSDKFDGNKAIKWGEYLSMYSKWIYNFDTDVNNKCGINDYECKFKNYTVVINGKVTSLDSIFIDLGIDYNEYVNSAFSYDFERLFRYKLAGLNIGELNEENIYNFESMPDEKEYINEKKKINDLNNSIYGAKKILIGDFYSNFSTTFNSNIENRFYILDNSLKQVSKYSSKKVSLTYKKDDYYLYQNEVEKLNENSKCSEKNTYNEFKECYTKFKYDLKNLSKKYEKASELYNTNINYYHVMTKAEAIEQIFNQVDFGLFDQELAKKKDTQIENNIESDFTQEY